MLIFCYPDLQIIKVHKMISILNLMFGMLHLIFHPLFETPLVFHRVLCKKVKRGQILLLIRNKSNSNHLNHPLFTTFNVCEKLLGKIKSITVNDLPYPITCNNKEIIIIVKVNLVQVGSKGVVCYVDQEMYIISCVKGRNIMSHCILYSF